MKRTQVNSQKPLVGCRRHGGVRERQSTQARWHLRFFLRVNIFFYYSFYTSIWMCQRERTWCSELYRRSVWTCSCQCRFSSRCTSLYCSKHQNCTVGSSFEWSHGSVLAPMNKKESCKVSSMNSTDQYVIFVWNQMLITILSRIWWLRLRFRYVFCITKLLCPQYQQVLEV